MINNFDLSSVSTFLRLNYDKIVFLASDTACFQNWQFILIKTRWWILIKEKVEKWEIPSTVMVFQFIHDLIEKRTIYIYFYEHIISLIYKASKKFM